MSVMRLFKKYMLIGRFVVSGTATTILYALLSLILNYYFKDNMMLNHVAAYFFSVPVSYLLQSLYTFRYKGSHFKASAKFFVLTTVGFFTGIIIVHFVEILNIHYVYGTILVSGFIPLINYIIMRLWVFSKTAS